MRTSVAVLKDRIKSNTEKTASTSIKSALQKLKVWEGQERLKRDSITDTTQWKRKEAIEERS